MSITKTPNVTEDSNDAAKAHQRRRRREAAATSTEHGKPQATVADGCSGKARDGREGGASARRKRTPRLSERKDEAAPMREAQGASFRRTCDFSVRNCFPRQFRTAEVRGVCAPFRVSACGEQRSMNNAAPSSRATSHARRDPLRGQTTTPAATERKTKEESAAKIKGRETGGAGAKTTRREEAHARSGNTRLAQSAREHLRRPDESRRDGNEHAGTPFVSRGGFFRRLKTDSPIRTAQAVFFFAFSGGPSCGILIAFLRSAR